MNLIEEKELIKKEEKLNKIESRIAKYEKDRMPNSVIIKWKLKFQKLNNYLNKCIIQRLIAEDESIKKIAKQNVELLKCSKLVFKTSRNGISFTGSHVTLLEGSIHENGHIYCEAKKTNLSIFNPFSQFSFPSAFNGCMDCLGNITLTKSETGTAFINTLPTKLEGEISDDGMVLIKTTERESELLGSRNYFISRIVSSYVFDSEIIRNEFFRNKEKLINLVVEYRKKIIAANNK